MKLSEETMNEVAELYYKNNASRLRREIGKVLKHINHNGDDVDNFVDLANVVFAEVLQAYEAPYENNKFAGFLFRCLENKFLKEIRLINRDKRCPYVRTSGNKVMKDENDNKIRTEIVRLDARISDSDVSVGEIIKGSFNEEWYIKDDRITRYLESISPLQRKIVQMMADGYKAEDIKTILNISGKQLNKNLSVIRSYKKVSVLLQD